MVILRMATSATSTLMSGAASSNGRQHCAAAVASLLRRLTSGADAYRGTASLLRRLTSGADAYRGADE